MNTICYIETINIVRIYSCLGVHIVLCYIEMHFQGALVPGQKMLVNIDMSNRQGMN